MALGKKEKVDIWSEEAVEEKPKAGKAQAGGEKKTGKEKKQGFEKGKKAVPEKAKEKAGIKKEGKKESGKEIVPAGKSEGKKALGIGEVIIYPLVSEKAVGAIESQNKISFIVNKKASKTDVKNAVEQLYSVKVESVKTMNDMQGRKKAIVRLDKKFKAQELATKLGVV